MIPQLLKSFVHASINAHRFRKYRKQFDGALSSNEIALVLPFLSFLLKPDCKIVYDIGAAKGEFATALAKQRNIKSVIAFEPLPDSWKILCRKAEKNPKIACFNTALGETVSTLQFFVTADGDSSSCLPPNAIQGKTFPGRGLTREITVPVATLDAFILEKNLPAPDIIIMDVQGYELHVLRGAERCLPCAKYCILECGFLPLYDGAPLVDDIWGYMKTRGWRLVGVGPQLQDKEGTPISLDLVFERLRGDGMVHTVS